MLPRHGRDFLERGKRLLVVRCPIPFEQHGEHDRVVGDHHVGDKPAALVADCDIQLGPANELFLAAHLGNGRAQLVVSLDAVLGTMDVPLYLGIAQIVQRVDAADQLVELEDRPAILILASAR